MILGALGKGIALGLGIAVPIGPINLEIARRTLRGGFISGLAMGCGAATVDITYAILSSVGLRWLLNERWILRGMGFAGGLLLIYLGLMSLRGALHPPRTVDDAAPPTHRPHTHYLTGLLMTCLSPMTLLFWFVAVPGVVGQFAANPRHDLPLVCAGVFFGTFGWICTFTSFVSLLGQWKTPRWLRIADLSGGLVLLIFAAAALIRSARGF